MNFPDRKHLLQLRKELWQRPHSRAAVMVGAGFSLNARPSPGVETPFLTWRQLTRTMFDEIYSPGDASITDSDERFKLSNPLRIASEYEAAFTRQKLESFLRSHVPDSLHQPGPIHDLLLQLPWRDVFTANYDTLLERTEVTERAYRPVMTVEDLTTAIPPRIIKLHGTLPSQPLVITEEDYRTYPKRFAPFVNTVRQSLIENSFVLIGFSGDDPNFLEWIGWIRDELDEHHAPIYLVGVLKNDEVQRSLLTKRGVTPIDLSPVFPRHSETSGLAIQWFLRNLMIGRPSSAHRWPQDATITQAEREYRPALFMSDLRESDEVSLRGSVQSLDKETAWKLLRRWKFERDHYPGWLVPPARIRSRLWEATERLIKPLIEFSKNLPRSDRILILYELNWRMEVSMMPLFDSTKELFEATIDDLFSDLRDGGVADSPSKAVRSVLSGVGIRDAWLEIAFALLREAREMYDEQRWNAFNERIEQVIQLAPEFSDRWHYEHALWLVWNIRRRETKKVLQSWSPETQSPLAAMHKAGVLAELDELNEAQSLLRFALRHIRRSILRSEEPTIYLLSLEGWCTYLLYRVECEIDFGVRSSGLYGQLFDRWQELETWDCSPWPILDNFDSALMENPPGPSHTERVVTEFDPGETTINRHIRNEGMKPWSPAFACIRLYEQVGIPIRFAGKALSNACMWIVPYNSFWSPALLVVGADIKNLTEENLLNRAQIASINGELATDIHQWAIGALKREQSVLPQEISLGSHLEKLLETLIEVLSRLTIKLGSEELQKAMSVALMLHSERKIYTNATLREKCRAWTGRLLVAAAESQIIDWLPDMIRLPIPEEDTISEHPLQWNDPVADVPLRVPENFTSDGHDNTSIWDAIAWLLDRARGASGEVWRRTVMRLIDLHLSGVMTSDQQAETSSILWKHTAQDEFPDLPSVDRAYFLHLPAPRGIDVVDKVRTLLLGGTPRRSVTDKPDGRISVRDSPEPLIRAIARASMPMIHVPYEWKGSVDWSGEEAKMLLSKVFEWWHNDRRALRLGRLFRAEGVVTTAQNAGMFLWRAVLPKMESASEDDWEQILDFLQDARRHGVHLTTAWVYLLIHRTFEVQRVARMIIDDLSSDEEDAVKAGAEALRHWIHLADAGLLEEPPTQTVEGLVHRVIFRRRIGVASCLRQLTLLLYEHPRLFDSCQVDLMVSSVTPWSESIRLPVLDREGGDFEESERPELRVQLGGFAAALSDWLHNRLPCRPQPRAITDLRDQYASDPLPEVRRSFDIRDQ